MVSAPLINAGPIPVQLSEPGSILDLLFATMDDRKDSLEGITARELRAVAVAYDKYDIPHIGYVIREEAAKLMSTDPIGVLRIAADRKDLEMAKQCIRTLEGYSGIAPFGCRPITVPIMFACGSCCRCSYKGYEKVGLQLKRLEPPLAAAFLHAMWRANVVMFSGLASNALGWHYVADCFHFLYTT